MAQIGWGHNEKEHTLAGRRMRSSMRYSQIFGQALSDARFNNLSRRDATAPSNIINAGKTK